MTVEFESSPEDGVDRGGEVAVGRGGYQPVI